MTATVDFRPPAELAPYPLDLRQEVQADQQRLLELAHELGYDSKAIVYLAIAELQRYRAAMHGYRAALAEMGAVRELPYSDEHITVSL